MYTGEHMEYMAMRNEAFQVAAWQCRFCVLTVYLTIQVFSRSAVQCTWCMLAVINWQQPRILSHYCTR